MEHWSIRGVGADQSNLSPTSCGSGILSPMVGIDDREPRDIERSDGFESFEYFG